LNRPTESVTRIGHCINALMEAHLVFFALTKHGLADIFDLARGKSAPIWVNQGLLDVADLNRLRSEGFNLTDFVYWIDPSDEPLVQEAVETIREHHPDQVLYIERCLNVIPEKRAGGS
jgi:hypothetical protein